VVIRKAGRGGADGSDVGGVLDKLQQNSHALEAGSGGGVE
jgi:hypothetical protein